MLVYRIQKKKKLEKLTPVSCDGCSSSDSNFFKISDSNKENSDIVHSDVPDSDIADSDIADYDITDSDLTDSDVTESTMFHQLHRSQKHFFLGESDTYTYTPGILLVMEVGNDVPGGKRRASIGYLQISICY